MFSAFIGHGPLYKSKRKNVGKLFTPVVTVAFVLLVAILLVCILAPVVAPYDPNAQDLTQVLAKPSAAHWLGCDQTGRDIFSRIIYGGRTALVSAVMVVVISVIIGIPLGLISGYKGWLADTIIMRCCDILLSFPSLLLAFVLVAGLGRNTFNAVLALGIVYVPMLTRLTRSLTLVEKNKVYVSACVSLGYSDTRILYRHILPNCISTILVQLTLDVAYAILDLASLSFLGLGTLPPQADWGAMLDEGRSVLLMSPVQSLSAGIVIVIVVVSLNIFSDGLHQYLDQAQTALPSFRKYEKKFEELFANQKEAMTEAVVSESDSPKEANRVTDIGMDKEGCELPDIESCEQSQVPLVAPASLLRNNQERPDLSTINHVSHRAVDPIVKLKKQSSKKVRRKR